jgi:hypothetical protein
VAGVKKIKNIRRIVKFEHRIYFTQGTINVFYHKNFCADKEYLNVDASFLNFY